MYKILLVADTPSVADELASALGSINYEFIMVDDGRNTRDAVKTHLPDLVIVDMQVGSMGGMAICLDLRLEESGGRLPSSKVLMIVDRRADIFLARRSSANGYLIKPLDPIRIRKAVVEILSNQKFEDPSFAPTETTPSV
ncbi:MAG: response regulator transcription factor [Acidimicrobiaceae bacterium]|jgi:DNA-binding response OmpR family regulator|nr:response regulator transcription factor [Acidimicrobiaceae bacterium]